MRIKLKIAYGVLLFWALLILSGVVFIFIIEPIASLLAVVIIGILVATFWATVTVEKS